MELKTVPYAHQAEEFERSKDLAARALLWQMRTGKSKIVVDTAAHLWDRGRIDGMIVVAPNGVHDNWVLRELPRHCPVPWIGHAWHSFDRTRRVSEAVRRRHAEGLRRTAELDDTHLAVLAVNSESLTMKDLQTAITTFRSRRRVMLVVDESHYFGKPGARRTRLVRGLATFCPYRRILTGTPVANSPLKTYSQFDVLERGALGFDRYAEFKAAYSYKDWDNVVAKVHYRNLDDLRERMAPWSSVVLREDCDDLPDLVEGRRYFDLNARQRKAYNDLREGLVHELHGGGVVTPADAGAAIVRLQQVTSNYVRTEAGTYEAVSDSNPRAEALAAELEDSGPTVVWCRFRKEIRQLADSLRAADVPFVECHGGVPAGPRRDAAIEAFQQGAIKVFLGQPRAGGHGINLSRADTVVWYSHTFDAEERLQASERATAVGGRSVALTDLVGRDTVDEYILATLADKGSVAADLAGSGLRDRLLEILGD